MKKLFVLPLLALLLAGCNNPAAPSEPSGDTSGGENEGNTFTINVSSWEEAESSHITRSSQGFTFSTSGDNLSGLISDGSLRIYAHMHLAISSETYTMSKIVFTTGAKKDGKSYKWGAGDLSTTTGEYTYTKDEVTGTWVGSSKSVVFDTNQQVRISSFSITVLE